MSAGALTRRSLLLWGALPLAARGQGGPAPWPTRPLRLIVPAPAYGAIDLAARLVAPDLQQALGQPVQVENRPGAEGRIGCAEVARASDQHTLLVGSLSTLVITPLLSSHLPYEPQRDFTPVGLIATLPLVLIVNPAVARSLDLRGIPDLVRTAQARPGRLLMASGGNGSPSHLAGELFQRMTQTLMLHFPYRNNAPARHEVVAGNMDLMFDNLPSALPQIRAGKLVALAVTGARRSPILPEVPTVDEAGGTALKGFEASTWAGVFAPASQPPEQVQRLQRETAAALAQPTLRDHMNALGLQPQGGGAHELAALVTAETARWARVVQMSGVKVDR